MEEILVVALQGLVEFFLEMLIYVGIDLSWTRDDRGVGCGLPWLFLLLGGCLGALANLLHPRLLMPTEGMRVAALIAGPAAAGGLSWLVARFRQRKGYKVVPSSHVVTAICFVLAFDMARYAYGTH
jgi:hypothetical protein